MLIRYLLTLTLLTWAFALGAQIPPACDPPDAPPSEDCENACIYCDFINGYAGTTIGNTASSVPSFCGSIENDQWFGFIAGATTATFTATPVAGSCQNGNGVQIGLYSACGGPFIQCNGGCSGCGNTPQSITVTNMVIGQNYFLLIDGWAGDQCDFGISVTPPAAVNPPPLGAPSNITGPAKVCPGGTGTYCINTVPGAGGYIWTIPADATLDGQPGPGPIELIAPDGKCAVITFGPSLGVKTICVTPANSCNTGVQKCRTVLIEPIPPKVLPPAVVCFEDAPNYQLPWGDPINETPATTNYITTITLPTGCDSIVSKIVTVKPQLIKNLPLQIICEGTCITIGGQQFCDPGSESVTIPSFQGCDSTINFTITVLSPIAEIIPGGTITCAQPTVTLNSAPSGGPVPTKIWKNGAGQQVGSGSSITVNTPGTYILTVTQQQGGVSCTKADTIVVAANNTAPTVTATGGVIGCSSTTATLMGTTNAPPTPTWAWSGPPPFTSTAQNPIASTPGTYTVTVTNSANGCTNSATTTVTGNTTAPVLTTTGGTLTCTTTSVTISVSSSITPASYLWTGPGGFGSTIFNPSVTALGTYDVTVTNTSNGCTSTANAVVTLDNLAPNAGASVSGNIGCNNPTVTLNGTSTTPNATYLWNGPNSFTSPLQNPTTSVTGTYTVIVTGPNGCTKDAMVDVNGSTTAPDVMVSGGTLTCTNPQIQINGNSNTPNVTYVWNGPGGPYNLQNPFVNLPGTYTLLVTNPVNGCTSTGDAIVLQDIATPTAGATGGIIDCTSGQVNINGSGSGTGNWTGPGGLNTPVNPTSVTQQGIYTWTVTGANGCTNAADATVTLDANVPVSFADGGTINCLNSTVTINGGVSTPGATFVWNGPGIVNSTNNMETVSTPGNYVLTATAANGCISTATAFVLLDDAKPGVSSTDGMVTCTAPSTQISATSTSSPVTYSWTGPNGFVSTDQNPIVMDAGTYTVIATGDNGCTSVATSTIQADQNQPIAQAVGGTLTCSAVAISIMGSVNIPGSTYAWTDGGSYSSIDQNPVVDAPGTYTLVVTSPNGCTDMATAIVDEDVVNPDATAVGGTLTCTDPTLILDGNSTTPGATFAWTGPNSFVSNISDPTADIVGPHILTVTAPNGCTTVVTAVVDEDILLPSFTSFGGTVSCAVLSINLGVQINTPGSTVKWTGPMGFTSTSMNPPTTVDGFYIVTVTAPNGCSDQQSVTVDADKDLPNVGATGGTLTCTTDSIALDGTSSTIGASFAWTGPGGFTASIAGPKVGLEGQYILTVTGPNGCTDSATATVDKDGDYPNGTAVAANVIDCTNPTTLLDGGSTTTGATISFDWTLGGNAFSGEEDPTATVPGIYTLAVTNVDNGCVTLVPVEVFEDVMPPQNVVADGGTLDCISGSFQMKGSTSSTGATFTWTGPGGFNSPLPNPTATNFGEYLLVVQLPNGCTASDTAYLFQNLDAPVVDIQADTLVLNCNITSIDLIGSTSTPNTTGLWTGPAGFSDTNATISITAPGTYNYTVTSTVNGCLTAKGITITQDIAKPTLTVGNAAINCAAPSSPLSSNSTTSGTTFAWTGPGGFTSNQQIPIVSVAGVYTCTATAPNGCTTSKSTTVTENFNLPQDILTFGATMTCDDPTPQISAESSSTGVIFSWVSPSGLVGNGPAVLAPEPGTYIVTVELIASGCEVMDSCVVIENFVEPTLVITASDTITCQMPSVNVSVISSAVNSTYSWTGPGINAGNKTQQSPLVFAAGIYKVTVTDTENGCTSNGQVTVKTDGSIPVVNIAGGIINCTNPTIPLTAMTDKNVSWLWSTGATTDVINISTGGSYSVVATDLSNGCTGQASVIITVDKAAPVVSIAPPLQFSCTILQVPLTATATPAGVTFDWTTLNGNIISATNGSGITVDQVGTYSVVVTDPVNGCTTLVSEDVTANPAVPSGFVLDEKDVRCHGETNGFASILGVTGGTPPYLYSLNGGPFSGGTNFTNLPAGTYSLAVEDALGCNYSTSFDIAEPPLIVVELGPDTTLILGDSILLDLTDLITPPGNYVMNWAGSFLGCDTCTDFWIKPLHTQQLVLTVIDSNGCRAQDVRFIEVDKQRHIYVPSAFAPESDNGNDLFYIFGGQDVEEIETFMVFDRWGEVVHQYFNFQPNDPDSGWDGTWRADQMNPAVYVWFAEIKFIDGVKKIYKGSVSLVR